MTGPANDIVHRLAHEAMGTMFEVMIADAEEKYAAQASQAVFQEINRLEALFSRFNASSEIGQINQLKPGQSMRIGLETYDCLKIASLVNTETNGAFDVNFRAAMKGKTFEVFRDKNGFSIKIQKTPIEQAGKSVDLDLGAIGKGYALDIAQAILADWGVERFLIHGGTSTAVAIGSAPGLGPGETGWPVGVGGIWTLAGAPKRVLLKERALSGSGTEVKGRHIQDPRTGRPSERCLAAWASHPRAAVADPLSTAFMVMSPEDVRSYCERHPDVWALLILDEETHHIFNQEIFGQHL
jgi:thiamine biosynthesis lipoprotein